MKKVVFLCLVVLAITIGYAARTLIAPDCSTFRIAQSTELLTSAPLTYEAAQGVIASVYALQRQEVHPRNGSRLAFTQSYEWRKDGFQHLSDFDGAQLAAVQTGWDEPVTMKMSELLACLGEPTYYSRGPSATPGISASTLAYPDAGLRVIILYEETADLMREGTEVEIFYLRAVHPAMSLEDFIRYAYGVDQTEFVQSTVDELTLWRAGQMD